MSGNSAAVDSPAASDSRNQEEAGSNPHLQIKDLEKTFGDIVACENINLDIGEDEFIVLLGPSGCGKTTTLRCIAGLEEPDKGTIKLDEREITHLKPKDRDIAFVFQNNTLFPHMSVRENMRFGLDMKTDFSTEEKNERVQEFGDMLGIGELLDRSPTELSGGQQQRVSLGRAMVMEPDAFLLDEPFSALDANLRDQMRLEIQRLHRNLETTTVFVTHDQEEAMMLADRIIVMNDGQLQQIGSPNEIYNDPVNLFVAKFIGSPSINTFDCQITQNEGLTIKNDLFTVSLSDEQAEAYSGTDQQSVVMAIRPEAITLYGSDQQFTGHITVIEPHGDYDAIHLEAEGLDFTVRSEQNKIQDVDVDTGVTFDTERIMLFSPEGERLL